MKVLERHVEETSSLAGFVRDPFGTSPDLRQVFEIGGEDQPRERLPFAMGVITANRSELLRNQKPGEVRSDLQVSWRYDETTQRNFFEGDGDQDSSLYLVVCWEGLNTCKGVET